MTVEVAEAEQLLSDTPGQSGTIGGEVHAPCDWARPWTVMESYILVHSSPWLGRSSWPHALNVPRPCRTSDATLYSWAHGIPSNWIILFQMKNRSGKGTTLIWVCCLSVNRLSKLYICSLCLKCMQSRSALSGHMVCSYPFWWLEVKTLDMNSSFYILQEWSLFWLF